MQNFKRNIDGVNDKEFTVISGMLPQFNGNQ